MFTITKQQVDTVRDLAYRKYGLFIGPDKVSRLIPKIERLINHEGYAGIDDLCDHLAAGDTATLEKFVAYITTCHTFFFREADHFQSLVTDIRRTPRTSYRIWCAACSTGEEPYSVAMTLLEAGITNFHITASDLNKNVLAEFNRGVYHESRLAQMPRGIKLRYFTPVGNELYAIDKDLRNYISIKNLNLMDAIKFPELFDYVFCRNVFIYFNEESRSQAIATITGNMRIGGTLFIGHAEVLLAQPDNLKKTGSSIYSRAF
jgi:chemotaxis protein methyltransferase CheR